jgi:uncharacterized protein
VPWRTDRACRLAEASACGDLGVVYLDGAGVATDVARGWALLERACDAGSPSSCNVLAARLRAPGPKSDPARALGLLKELCDVNDGEACMELGRLAILGEGVPSDTRAPRSSSITGAEQEAMARA